MPISETLTTLSVTIHEGKNREIRKVMRHVGLVEGLKRVSFGPYGGIREVGITPSLLEHTSPSWQWGKE
jgi:16S rRNA U516 pseudouridylate synthase RsuA-like enzyme